MSEPIYPQSAVVPYRVRDGRVEILLITTLRRKRWIVPKGLVEPGLSPAQSAACEAIEEAGVTGHVDDENLGVYEYRKWGGTCRVEVFPMEVQRELLQWPEGEMRRRRWVAPDEVEAMIKEAPLRRMIADLVRRLSSGGKTNAIGTRPPADSIVRDSSTAAAAASDASFRRMQGRAG